MKNYNKITNFGFRIAVSTGMISTGFSQISGGVFSYDFDGQWNNDFDVFEVSASGSTAPGPGLINYSKRNEGRVVGTNNNVMAGVMEADGGYRGSATSIFDPTDGSGVVDMSTPGATFSLIGSFSTFSAEDSYAAGDGSSEVGQVGLLSAPSFSGSNSDTLKLGDSLYLGFTETYWQGQTFDANGDVIPGNGTIEAGIFKDGVLEASLGTFNLNHMGGRYTGGQVWGNYFEYDLTFTNNAGVMEYDVALNLLDYYADGSSGTTDDYTTITESNTQFLGAWSGSISGSDGGLSDLTDLRPAYGFTVVDSDVSITGATFDYAGRDFIIPEPSAALLACIALFGLATRRKR